MTVNMISPVTAVQHLKLMREQRPLVHCLTNEVVQEITANVLLAAGASPAMVVAREEVEHFTKIASALLINTGTLTTERTGTMLLAAKTASGADVPWVLDPVAAGVIPWRDEMIQRFLALKPTCVRGNASEIMAIMGASAGGKGVDSLDSSDSALEVAIRMARQYSTIVCVTGETDYVTNGTETLAVQGGDVMTTLVVGTGCSLSALVAAFLSVGRNIEAVASACFLSKAAAQFASISSRGPGTYHASYIDGLYQLQPENMVLGGSMHASN